MGWIGRGSPTPYPERVNKPDNSATAPDPVVGGEPPRSLRIAGALTALEGAVALVYAIILVIRQAAGHHEDAISGYGTAAWFGIIFGGVLVGGLALLCGRRWGRAISLVAQILLLPVSYYLFTSHQPAFAVPLGLIAVVILVLLFLPGSIRWIAADLEPETPTSTAGTTGRKPGSSDRPAASKRDKPKPHKPKSR